MTSIIQFKKIILRMSQRNHPRRHEIPDPRTYTRRIFCRHDRCYPLCANKNLQRAKRDDPYSPGCHPGQFYGHRNGLHASDVPWSDITAPHHRPLNEPAELLELLKMRLRACNMMVHKSKRSLCEYNRGPARRSSLMQAKAGIV